jgi:hypothetical protein
MFSGARNDRHSRAFFGDVVSEVAIITDGDECLFVGYGKVGFLAPTEGIARKLTPNGTGVPRRAQECRRSPGQAPQAPGLK